VLHTRLAPASSTPSREDDLQERARLLQGEIARLTAELAQARLTIQSLRARYGEALEQLQLARRRVFFAKAERFDTQKEQLAFDEMLRHVEQLEKEIAEAEQGAAGATEGAPLSEAPSGADGHAAQGTDSAKTSNAKAKDGKEKPKPKGRRSVASLPHPIVRIEIRDPELEATGTFMGFENSWHLGFEPGGQRRILVARAAYKVTAHVGGAQGTSDMTFEPVADPGSFGVLPDDGEDDEVIVVDAAPVGASDGADGAATQPGEESPIYFVRAPKPKELIRRSLLAPSMIAHILVGKYVLGVPFFRLERKFELEGVPISRGLMCRYAEEVGGALGAIVEACRAVSIAHAFCLSTDATGVLIQPEPQPDKRRQPCRKGHFFVTLADKDYAFFDFTAKHTSRAVWDLFNGYQGFIQADAHAIYDALFAGRAPEGAEPAKGPPPTEVGCLAHVRRRFWEAAVSKHTVGLEGVVRIKLIYEADEKLDDLSPAKRTVARQQHVKPLVDRFFAWVASERATPGHGHLVADALGYAARHEKELRTFLLDGRLRMDNNRTESAARTVAIGRKAWLFYGSDDHATSGGNLMSLVASCFLHRLNPESYLTEIIRLTPYWPKDRFLELAPKFWAATRARLDPLQIGRDYGVIDVPPPLPIAADAPPKEQAAALTAEA